MSSQTCGKSNLYTKNIMREYYSYAPLCIVKQIGPIDNSFFFFFVSFYIFYVLKSLTLIFEEFHTAEDRRTS